MSNTYTFETTFEIWNDQSGECIEVGPDRDGLNLIEIRYRDSDSQKITQRISFDTEQATMVADALQRAVANFKNTK